MKSLRRAEQEEGHPQPSPSSDAVPMSRIVLWSGVAFVVLAGLVLFFRYEREISPLFGGP